MSETANENDLDLSRAAARSRAIAVLIILGFLGFTYLLGGNVAELNDLDEQIQAKEIERQQISDEIQSLKAEIQSLRYSSSNNLVATATPLQGILERGRQVYDFATWVDVSSYRLQDLEQITYSPTGENPPFVSKVSELKGNGFAMTYRGTCCPESVNAQMSFKDGTKENVMFDLCSAVKEKSGAQLNVCGQ